MTSPNPSSLPSSPEQLESVRALVETVYRLRAPGGCPWDRKQTHQTLRPYVIEEAYEVLDVLDQIDSTEKLRDPQIRGNFREELGDLLMQVVLHSEMTREEGAFDFYDVARTLNEKLIRRHPHVFGDTSASDADSALASWEKQKQKEKEAKAQETGSAPAVSVLDGMPKGLPSLQRTARVIEKVTKVGFQWEDLQGPLAKLDEELAELKVELESGDREKIQDELGDLFFSLCNIAHFSKINPEDALRSTLRKFERRFRFVEDRLRESGKKPEDSTLEEMDRYWDAAKAAERAAEQDQKK